LGTEKKKGSLRKGLRREAIAEGEVDGGGGESLKKGETG